MIDTDGQKDILNFLTHERKVRRTGIWMEKLWNSKRLSQRDVKRQYFLVAVAMQIGFRSIGKEENILYSRALFCIYSCVSYKNVSACELAVSLRKFLWKFIYIVYELHFSFAWFVQIFNCFICFSFHSRTFVFNFHFHFRTSVLPNLRPLSIWLCFVLTTPIWPGLFLLILFLFILHLILLSFLLLILYCLSTLPFLYF